MPDEGVVLTPRELQRALGRLTSEELAAFVAALYEKRGWSVAREGTRVTLSRASPPAERTVLATTDPASVDADAVAAVDRLVTPRASATAERLAGDAGVTLVTAEDLRELLAFGLDRETADALLRDHADAPAVRDRSDDGSATVPLPSRRTALLALLTVALAAAIGAAALGDLPGGGPGSPTAGNEATTTDGEVTTTPTPTIEPPPQSVLEPDCDLPPQTVVEVQVSSLRKNDPLHNHGIRTVWNYMTAESRENMGDYDSLVDILRTAPFQPLFTHGDARYGNVTVEGEYARQNVTVVTNGSTSTYVFELRQGNLSPPDATGCWLLDDVTPASFVDRDDGNRSA